MDNIETDKLRSIAPNWSLSGDKQLLDLLNNLHKKIISRCEEANVKLDEMVDALDTASIDLQNVNNKFMALSNSQFIESRVYDDDIVPDVSNEDIPKQEKNVDEFAKMQQCLNVLENMHESVTILDSDSSDDDDEGRLVLKPKDMYADRPLPYIIGSQAWKNKWHAGLVVEDSDTDSEESKPNEPSEEYSESEPEAIDIQTDKQFDKELTISGSNNSMEINVAAVQAQPADIAAELARRLGGHTVPAPHEVVPPPEPTIRKTYRAEPTRATLFTNEPPPLDYGDQDSDDESDIYSTLHKKPYSHDNRAQNKTSIADELFGSMEDNVIDEQTYKSNQNTDITTKKPEVSTVEDKIDNVKKPVGGISLFGNKHSDSIGAAILKRNRRKSSSEDDDVIQSKNSDVTTKDISSTNAANRNIIDELFAKPKSVKTLKKTTAPNTNIDRTEAAPQKPIVDLFNNDIFDDIDDIFTTKVSTDKTGKPLDLFAENKATKSNVKSIFDSDDELFSEIIPKKDTAAIKPHVDNENKTSKLKNTVTINDGITIVSESKNKSIFGDDTDDELFGNKVQTNKENDISKKKSIFDDSDDDLFVKSSHTVPTRHVIKPAEKSSIFDDESDDGLFSDISIKVSRVTDEEGLKQDNSTVNDEQTEEVKKSSRLFDGSESITKEIVSQISTPVKITLNKSDEIIPKEKETKHLPNINVDVHVRESKKQSPSIFDDDDFLQETVYSDRETTANIETQTPKDNINKTTTENISNDNICVSNKKVLDIYDSDQSIKNSDIIDTEYVGSNTQIPNIKPEETEKRTRNDTIKYDSKENLTYSDNNKLDFSPNVPSSLNDIFTDLPPEFEKTKEPKKSKNINALFDDDSDDEALFFKESDLVDEPVADDYGSEGFSIYHDEPPAVDVDFTPKPRSNITIASTPDSTEGIFTQNITEINETVQPDNTEFKSEIDNANSDDKLNSDSDQTKKVNKISHERTDESQANTTIDNYMNPVGKLKTVNLNIDVATLLPGASPKKSKSVEETDGSKDTWKSVNFDQESGMLDNKISKDRAKIQVKRRPSTRKARKEAVKKVTDIGGSFDSTDNSSSLDDPLKIDDTKTETNNTEDINKTNNPTYYKNRNDNITKVVYIYNDEDLFSDLKNNKNDVFSASEEEFFKPTNSTGDNRKIHDKEEKSDDPKKLDTLKNKDKGKKKPGPSIFDLSDSESELFGNRRVKITPKAKLFDSDSDEDLFSGKK